MYPILRGRDPPRHGYRVLGCCARTDADVINIPEIVINCVQRKENSFFTGLHEVYSMMALKGIKMPSFR